MIERNLVGVLDTPSYPTEEAIKNQLYLYQKPCMPKEAFLHYLTSQKAHRQRRWLNQLPAKLKTSVHFVPVTTSGQVQSGQAYVEVVKEEWGVRIIEGPNRVAMFWTSMLVVAIAVAVSAVYLKCSGGDVQGATGIGALIAALWAIVMPALYFKWSVT